MAKISDEIRLVWLDILREIPTSHLLIKNKGLIGQTSRKNLLNFFLTQGIAVERIELCSWVPSVSEHLSQYNRIDIALDTFPYHGTTTTFEALWMGVPVITLEGKVHASRVGISILTNMGLPEFIAKTKNEYKRIAVHFSHDLNRLNDLRNTLRGRMTKSTLTDAHQFVVKLEKAFRQMWEQWCQKI